MKSNSISHSFLYPEVMTNTTTKNSIKASHKGFTSNNSQNISPSSVIKSTLTSHLKLAAKTEFLEECGRVQDTVRNSVESLGKILNGTTILWKPSSITMKDSIDLRFPVKNSELKVRNNEQRVRSYSSNNMIGTTKRCQIQIKKAEICGVKVKPKIGYKEKLLAVYKGWKIRSMLKKEGLSKIIKEIKSIYIKIKKIKNTNQSGMSILKSAYEFKKRQFHMLLSSKITSTPHKVIQNKGLHLTRGMTQKNLINTKKFSESTKNSFNFARNNNIKNIMKSNKLNTTNIVVNINEATKNINTNPLETLAQLNSFLMKIRAEKLSSKKQCSKEQWSKNDKKFNGLIDELKTIYENMKRLL